MKWLVTPLVLLAALPLYAQNITKLDVKGYYPQFSPDGKQILLTSSKFTGLKILNLENKQLRSLTDVEGAGYEPVFEDGKVIFTNKKLKSVNEVDLFSGKQHVLQNSKLPPALFKSKQIGISQSLKQAIHARPNQDLSGIILTYSDQSEVEIAPQGKKEDYVWISLSPDRKKVLYKAAGYKAFVTDLNGKVLADLGDIEAPKWANDDQIVYMVTEDDHLSYTKADVFMMDWQKKQVKALTTASSALAMYPSAYANKVVFNTPEGDLYLIEME
ncbi:hypothetical protein V6R21_03050 [Limibacter armeniacum]|uniref:hypothetical protein n=1 Tax=Limibacter armeniacum TaxID=466084 RepID=UPI002FE5F699